MTGQCTGIVILFPVIVAVAVVVASQRVVCSNLNLEPNGPKQTMSITGPRETHDYRDFNL